MTEARKKGDYEKIFFDIGRSFRMLFDFDPDRRQES
jgi:hypothetical protein